MSSITIFKYIYPNANTINIQKKDNIKHTDGFDIGNRGDRGEADRPLDDF